LVEKVFAGFDEHLYTITKLLFDPWVAVDCGSRTEASGNRGVTESNTTTQLGARPESLIAQLQTDASVKEEAIPGHA